MQSSIPLALEVDGRHYDGAYIVAGNAVFVTIGERCASGSVGRLGPTFAARSLIRDLVRQRGRRGVIVETDSRSAVRLVPRIP